MKYTTSISKIRIERSTTLLMHLTLQTVSSASSANFAVLQCDQTLQLIVGWKRTECQ